MPWFINSVVADIFPFIVKVDELVKELLELIAVVLDGFNRHYLTHIGTSGRISNHSCASADEHYWSMTVFLHIHHDDDLHEMTDMKTVSRRVKPDIKFNFLILQKLTNLFFVR